VSHYFTIARRFNATLNSTLYTLYDCGMCTVIQLMAAKEQ